MPGACILLDVLEPLGYIDKTKGQYRNGGITKKWMLKGSGINYAPGFRKIVRKNIYKSGFAMITAIR